MRGTGQWFKIRGTFFLVDKAILTQYCDMKNEIKDIRARIKKLDRFLENPPIVSDTVKGTRRDGTFGPIRITGIPEQIGRAHV